MNLVEKSTRREFCVQANQALLVLMAGGISACAAFPSRSTKYPWAQDWKVGQQLYIVSGQIAIGRYAKRRISPNSYADIAYELDPGQLEVVNNPILFKYNPTRVGSGVPGIFTLNEWLVYVSDQMNKVACVKLDKNQFPWIVLLHQDPDGFNDGSSLLSSPALTADRLQTLAKEVTISKTIRREHRAPELYVEAPAGPMIKIAFAEIKQHSQVFPKTRNP